MRVRLIYEKRGGACFVPHVALSTLFTRAARRAGITLIYTQGFSPRAKISFGPELPAGVVALNEPVDLWLSNFKLGENCINENNKYDQYNFINDAFINALNAQMPDGFRIKNCFFLADDAVALGKECVTAHYFIWHRNKNNINKNENKILDELLEHINNYYGEAVLNSAIEIFDKISGEISEQIEEIGKRISVVLAKPAQNGISGWVKALVSDGISAGWSDLCIVRSAIGR